MTRTATLTGLAVILLATFPQTTTTAQETFLTASLRTVELNSAVLATTDPGESLSEFPWHDGWMPASQPLHPELQLNLDFSQMQPPMRYDPAEEIGNWLVVFGFGLTFTAGLIITISTIHQSSKQPKAIF